jgi:nicotinate-nucleotide pyrophosphorylase (carboxylating)
MNALIVLNLRRHLQTSLEEDGGSLDWTSRGVTPTSKKATATILAKSDGVWCGEWLCPAVEGLAREMNLSLQVKSLKRDGERVRKGEKVVRWSGDAEAILVFERSFLNLASYLSGISTRTRTLVDLVDAKLGKKAPRITATRKILPGYRDLALYAVICGGGYSHRVNLSGGVLIKENHIRSAGSIRKAIEGVRAIAPHGLKTEVEVTNLKELKEALAEKAEIVMLDNFSPEEVASALKITAKANYPVCVEVSGGLSESTIQQYAISGVNVLSIGGLTHSVRAFDLSLLFDERKK